MKPVLGADSACDIILRFNTLMNRGEYEALMADTTKRIEQDVRWVNDEHHSPARSFRAKIVSDPGYPLFAKSFFNRAALRLSYVLIHRGEGRIYGLRQRSSQS